MALLTLKDIGKIYVSDGNVAVGIRGVNLSFDRGEFVAVTGKSGSGKSTLLNVIGGMDTYEEGELLIEGETTSHYLQPDWEEYCKKYISFIFQDYNIIESYTVLQNVELALMHISDKKERRRRALELIDRVGLTRHLRHKGSKLSGGQKQRTVIARALAKDSPIILADEPTGNLDSVTSKEIIDLLREVSRDKLLIMVTHNFEQVEHCATRHVRIFDGTVESDHVFSRPIPTKTATAEHAVPVSRKKSDGRKADVRNGITLGLSMFTSRPRLSLFLCLLMIIGNLGIFFITASSGDASDLFEDYKMFTHIDGRVVLTTRNGVPITDEELKKLAEDYGAESYLHYDRLLDEGHYYAYVGDYFHNFKYAYNEDFGDDIVGHYPTARDEIFLYLPIGSQEYFGKDAIAMETLNVENLSFRIVGLKYFYDNNQTGKILFHADCFRTVTAANCLINNSEKKITVQLKADGSTTRTYTGLSVYPFFNMEGNSVYVSDAQYQAALKTHALAERETETTVSFSATYYGYNYYNSNSSTQNTYETTFTNADLTSVSPGSPAVYWGFEEDMYAEKASGVGSYLAVSADCITEMGEDFLSRSYRQASLFFANDKAAAAAAEKLSDNGYIAVPSNATYTPDPMETVLTTLGAILAVLMWLAVIFFIAFFINLCSTRSLNAFKGDMAIMRSMGIPVRVIRVGMYVRMLLALIPAYLTVMIAATVIYRTPALNTGGLVYLYPWHYAVIFLGMLILTVRVTRIQIKKLFRQSVKKALKGDASV